MASIISHALPCTMSSLLGGIRHGIFAPLTSALGIPQKLMNFTPPLAKMLFSMEWQATQGAMLL